MGGLKKYLPTTHWTMCFGWLAICGIIPFAGFFSKDEILWKTFSTSVFPGGVILWAAGFATAGITAFYMTRLMALTFWGEERFRKVHAGGEADEAYAAAYDKELLPHDATVAAVDDRPYHRPGEHVGAHDASDQLDAHDVRHAHFEPHESPSKMTMPLIVLAVGALVVGFFGIPRALSGANINVFEHWLEPVIADMRHEAPRVLTMPAVESRVENIQAEARAEHEPEPINPNEYVLMLLSLAIAAGGIFLGRSFYVNNPELPKQWAARLRPLYKLSFNKWYWDWLLDVKGVEAGKAINNGLWRVDATVVDGGVNGSAWFTRLWSRISGWWDKWVIDLAVNLAGWITQGSSFLLRAVQTGLWQNYALLFALGLFLILIYYVYPAVMYTIRSFTQR